MLVKGAFEDFIYILAGLVWVAFSIYKGSQKQKKAQKPGNKTNSGKSAIEEILGEFLGVKENNTIYQEDDSVVQEENSQMYYEEEAIPEVKERASEVFSYDDVYEKGNFFDKNEVYKKEDTIKQHIEEDTKVSTSVKKRKKPIFNVRKAIIYSEILRRPSY